MSGAKSRSKGQRGEREIVNLLKASMEDANLDASIGRNLQQWAEGGCDIKGIDWLAIEVKFQETENVGVWWAQACQQASKMPGNPMPVLFYRRSRQPWRVVTYVWLGMSAGCGQWVPATLKSQDWLSWFTSEVKRRYGVRVG